MSDNAVLAEKPKDGGQWDIAIIGSGPAGLTAAIYATRGAASTIVFAGDKWGGQLMLTTTVDNFPGFPSGIQGPELMFNMRKQAKRFGAEIIDKNVLGVDFEKHPFEIATDSKVYYAKSVIIATGSITKWLGVPGEDRLLGRGVSSCAPCDAPFFKEKRVVVIGGGDSAMEEALVLTKYSKSVTIVHRRSEFKASAAMQARVFQAQEEGKIKIIWDSEITEILGGNLVEAVRIKTSLNSKSLDNIKKDNEAKLLEEKEGFLHWEKPIDGVFVAIGHIPATDIFSGKIKTDEKGYIVVDKVAQTEIKEGVFVAGDVHDFKYRQAITAAGFGCMAAMDALKFLDKDIPNW
jgi:thioredoxin reductase (NADPH)